MVVVVNAPKVARQIRPMSCREKKKINNGGC